MFSESVEIRSYGRFREANVMRRKNEKPVPPARYVLQRHCSLNPELTVDPDSAWIFGFALGRKPATVKWIDGYAWAVHSGDVGASVVPIPSVA